MTTLPTPAELRELADDSNSDLHWLDKAAKIQRALRQFASLIEDAEKGVTDEVVEIACKGYSQTGFIASSYGMLKAVLAVAPHLALTKDKPSLPGERA